MSDNTKIEWASATWNPWEGCTKVSPGCANCYAAARNRRFGMDNWGKGKPRRRTSPANWKKPLLWNKANRPEATANRPRIFPSLCDWLDEEVPIEWLADLLKLIHDTPNLDWLLLTKRPENWEARLMAALEYLTLTQPTESCTWLADWLGVEFRGATNPAVPLNVWLGVSVEDQQQADERIPKLLSIPAKVRFLSCEPLLGPVTLDNRVGWLSYGGGKAGGVQWVIIGGESGPGARPCDVDWIRSLVRQCRAAGVAPFVKQLGSEVWFEHCTEEPLGLFAVTVRARFKKAELKHPKGGDPAEWPQHLRVREFPTA